MSAAALWWKIRKSVVGKKKSSGAPVAHDVVCHCCGRRDRLSIVKSRARTGQAMYLAGCERCNQRIRFVPKSAALGIAKHYVM